ncbi:MAG TPA: hypothetical protein VHV77_04345, partial [Pirellulales bacterium]|nr:hypothetical protein [Pirellulales bacterium]
MRLVGLIFAVGLLVFASAGRRMMAQQPAIIVPAAAMPIGEAAVDDEAFTEPPSTADVASAIAKTSGDKSVKAKPKSRLERLKELKFDRSPAAWLKAWAIANGAEPSTSTDDTKVVGDAKANGDAKAADKPKSPDPLDAELKAFQADVTLGQWSKVKTYLSGLPEAEGKAAWQQLLASLTAPAPHRWRPGVPSDPNVWGVDDLLGLAAARPVELDKKAISSLGQLLAAALERDLAAEAVASRLAAALDDPAEKHILTRRQVAQLLEAAGQHVELASFLPTIDEAIAAEDAEALNLLSQYCVARWRRDGKADDLDRAWRATQAVLAILKASATDKKKALECAVDLAQQVRVELGQKWLDDSFARDAQQGAEILAALGRLVGHGFEQHPRQPEERLKPLALQKAAVDALLKANRAQADAWRTTLQLFALEWLREAEYSREHDQSQSSGSRMRSDAFGNVYFHNFGDGMMAMGNHDQPLPIAIDKLLELAPEKDWAAVLDEPVRVRVMTLRAELLLKVNHEERAFPLIEQLAPTYPKRAQSLAEEFLRVWKSNHDPNQAERYMNPFYFYYGFNNRAQSIPLTRSKQERNLVELAGWTERLKKLPIPKLDERLLTEAFTTCHSSAEVYRLAAIERVFGPIDQLKAGTLAALAQQMRQNLASLWRAPQVQEAAKTRRKTKDTEAEVLRGYDVARDVVTRAQTRNPDEWSLTLASAALELDESNYRQELAKDPTFQERRQRAMAGFAKAAQLYTATAPQLAEEDESIEVFEQWFYASLGACDLESIDDEKQPDPKQTARVRAALDELPGKLGERHRERFASQLFTHLRSVKPVVKFRYLREGFAIVGDHPLADDAHKVFDYYRDLVTEIKLDVSLDGAAANGGVVGHEQPFGIQVNLRHTPEIERESGGFGRFLQNQNAMMFGYNFGRPTVDYRDRFATAVRESLNENYEVVSITFETDKVRSKETAQPGWRVTPYAYLLVKARGPQVDKLPPLKMDLDFLDTSGYVVLPVESPAVPLDARPPRGAPRQAENVALTQILDERQADTGKLLLEIKASARGLVPNLDELVDLQFEGFEIAAIDDRGVAVAKFDDESPRVAILSERSWVVRLDATDGPVAAETPFHFAASQLPEARMTWHRYSDADLENVGESVTLQSRYGQRNLPWLAMGIAAAMIAILAAAGFVMFRRLRAPAETASVELPDPLTPFSV